jgi:hypothetical protein
MVWAQGVVVQRVYVQYNINKQKGWKEQASKRQQKKERRQDWAGDKRGYIATGMVRARPCEERRGGGREKIRT